MEKTSNNDVSSKPSWLSFSIAIIAIFFVIIFWFCLNYQFPFQITEIQLPWIALILGIVTAILLVYIFYLLQLLRINSKKVDKIDQNFKQELVQHMHSEETKQKLERALLQGQKLQAIGTLAGGIAHDFNNILYAITGYVEMAREDVGKDTIMYKNLGKVLDASHRGKELIGRILSFSRRHHLALKPIKIKHTLENVLALLRPTIPASVLFNINLMPNEVVILGDPTRLHQVVVNIINNAVDAMDGEGTVTISAVLILKNDPLLTQIPGISSQNYCKIDITDTGHGMDQHIVERIFEPFYTTKEVGKGTGLGLATVHTIIQEHKGKILVNSQLGTGTTFTFLLPEFVEENENGKNITG